MMNCDTCGLPILSDEKMTPSAESRHAFLTTCVKRLLAENKQLHMEVNNA